jgi:hypothetical protein
MEKGCFVRFFAAHLSFSYRFPTDSQRLFYRFSASASSPTALQLASRPLLVDYNRSAIAHQPLGHCSPIAHTVSGPCGATRKIG